ncbi:MFS transporter [Amphiplicatus metriothermophilus]|uniref:Transmembrane secretion effector n=1 Tax=Amphiplicatus metriothermophilus TaxID=1519374 RepID=A0A239PZ15_9PROT|nr:MFS transporter [Amphiplicatus metriothermophilus]MBB5520008.1 MFS family permease [Amphiplicatus metriothermophilus]SNT74907.1 Transmembrane secretion effector [Amphiplicatus metriothermophilus]
MALAPSLAVFRHSAYLRYWIMRQLLSGGRQMLAVAIGWQVYDLARLTRSIEESAFLLGLVGLVQFLPVLLLSLVGGQAADRFDRKTILIVSNLVRLAAVLGLLATAGMPANIALPAIFVVAAVFGGVNAFTPAASNSLYPTLVPRAELHQAIAWNSLGYQGAAILGPALGGVLYIWGPQVVYGTAAAMTVAAIVSIAAANTPKPAPVAGARGLAMVFEGLRYVRDNKTVFGAISLDLVVVLFGGVTALLPVFARDILHVGSEGLGALRAAPALGAALVAAALAARPLSRKVGPWMLGAIGVYGAAMLVFAWSPLFWLSIIALAVTGAADMISVYVRQSLIQFATPDAMRGRVSSVSFIFISASNELGEFESGVAARFLGPVGAVVLGGTVAIATALAWTRLFPQLARADRFEDAALAAPAAPEAAAAKPT